MKAAVLEKAQQPMVVKDVPVPSVGANDVLIKVRAAGVCHTDIHIVDGILAGAGLDPFPLIMGHEIVGEVERVGSHMTHLKTGDRVGAYWQFGCGHCHYCRSGKEQTCITNMSTGKPRQAGMTLPGGYAEYFSVGADYAMPLPDALEFVDAAPFLCAGLTVYGGFKNSALRPGQRAAILGVGGLGHMAIPVAKALGAEVIAITSTESKQATAQKLGADHTICATGTDVGKKLLEMGGADVVLSTTVNPDAINGAMQGLLPQGTMVLIGLTTNPLPVIPLLLLVAEQRVIGSFIGSRSDFQELMQLAVQNNIRPVTETYALDDVNTAHAKLREGKVRYRAVLTPN
ncbi:MAG: alcohol dehydrogenase catalytic domain-containing protein [Aggregatilineales bacterium]